MKLGDKIKMRCRWTEIVNAKYFDNKMQNIHEYATGTVVYLHPRGRYYTLEFNFPCGTFRESFKCVESQ